MGILDRFVGGPVEPSAAERAAVGVVARCTACHTVGLPTVRIPLDGHGHVDVCTDPAGCRVRAQGAGIWGVA